MQVQNNETSTGNNHVLAGIGEVSFGVRGGASFPSALDNPNPSSSSNTGTQVSFALSLLVYLPSVWSLQGNESQEACTLLVS
jgi:hypothetical protein